MMNFMEACYDVLENNVEYKRENDIGIRKSNTKFKSIEFFRPGCNEKCHYQTTNLKDLTCVWIKIEPKKESLSNKIRNGSILDVPDVKETIQRIIKRIENQENCPISIIEEEVGKDLYEVEE